MYRKNYKLNFNKIVVRSIIYTLFLMITVFSNAFAKGDIVEVDLYIKDHKFNPKILELPAGKKIVIALHNQDKTIEEFESYDLKREKIVLGNSSIRIVLAPLKVGEYKFFGEFHEETAQGKIIIKLEE